AWRSIRRRGAARLVSCPRHIVGEMVGKERFLPKLYAFVHALRRKPVPLRYALRVMIVLYARVSTTDQTTAHQVTQAKAAGFKIDEVVSDEGVSGIATKLCEREQGKRLFDMLRSGDTLVVRWVDRLGRNYIDVVDTIRDFMRRGVIIRTVI